MLAVRRLPGRRLLATMPKNVDLTERRQARSAKTRKLKSVGQASTVKLQVLGTGAEGAPRALYVFTTTASYLFNCGEGTQRLSHERKTRLARLENVFVTSNSWSNVGGLLGAILTLNDIGLPALTLHGPPGLDALYRDTRSFIQLRGMAVAHRADVNTDFVDTGLTVRAVPLYGAAVSRQTAPASDSPASPPPVDYFAYERTGGGERTATPPPPPPSAAPQEDGPGVPERAVTYAYVCTVPDWPGRLCLEKCVSRGVKPGPLLGKLKAGHDVVLEDGTIVRSADVTLPDEIGPQFVVMELPSADFLPSLSELDSSIDASRLAAVVHFSPAAVMDEPIYRSWRGGLPAGVRQVVLNEAGGDYGSEAIHRMQYQLNTIDGELFPLLEGETIDVDGVVGDGQEDGVPCKRPRLSSDAEHDRLDGDDGDAEHGRDGDDGAQQPPLVHPQSGWGLSLRPAAPPDTEGVIPINPEAYRAVLAADETFMARLDEYRRGCAALPPQPAGDVYPQTVFLGTGSSIPNKKRNTSGILVNLSGDHCVLLDCGEGTHGQLVRLQGSRGAADTLRRLGAVFISHMHADHHIGLISILEARRRAMGADHQPCLLLAPATIATYLKMYHNKMAPLLDTFTLVDNRCLLSAGSPPPRPGWLPQRLSAAGLRNLSTCRVLHCMLAYGVRFAGDGGRSVVYSGDTRPCDELVTLGQDCDLLIHEATLEDDLQKEAEMRAHCTMSEAIGVGRRMSARHVLLTHFSQRYSELPLLPEPPPDNAGIAYDNMVVDFCQLPRLPLLYPCLRQAFSESYDMCLERSVKRKDRKLRGAELLASAELV